MVVVGYHANMLRLLPGRRTTPCEAQAMNSKEKIHASLQECCDELLAYVKEREPLYEGGWVPAAEIKENLGLNLPAVPKDGTQHGPQGWLFATLARMLEDAGRLEYKKVGRLAFCRNSRGQVDSQS